MTDSGDIFKQVQALTTEQRNERTRTIDLASSEEIVAMLGREDTQVAQAVTVAAKDIARAIDLVTRTFKRGGRLRYIGAGTSGRLGILDASECPPTFGVAPDLVEGIIAGGRDTVFLSREGLEDEEDSGVRDIAAAGITDQDTVMGITASSRTPYVLGALREARRRGAGTIFFSCNDGEPLDVDVQISVVVGPEAIAGSTRMKSGTAQKMVLNMISTGAMVKWGKVYENLMVDLKPNSAKLIERGKGIVMSLCGFDYDRAQKVYEAAGRKVKVAVVMGRSGISREAAEQAVDAAEGFLARALGER